MTPYVVVGLLLFLIGFYATITRTNLLQVVIGLEIMARGVSLIFILAGAHHGNMGVAQVVVITTIVIEAVTVAIALSLVVAAYHHNQSISVDSVRRLKG